MGAADAGGRRDSASPGHRLEGLAWLGREPEAAAGPGFRTLRALGVLVGGWVLGFRLRTEGLEQVPHRGYILAAALHRSWVDPLVLVAALPAAPRLWYLGSAETVFRSRPRAMLMRRLGGFLPVWRGGTDLSVHVAAARAVLDAGAVFAVFPEGSRRGGPTDVQRLRRGTALIGLRTGSPILPVAMAGSHELYRGRRFALRVLPPTSALELAGLAAPPEPGSAAELAAIHVASDALRERLAPHVAELAAWCEDPPAVRRRWGWLNRVVA